MGTTLCEYSLHTPLESNSLLLLDEPKPAPKTPKGAGAKTPAKTPMPDRFIPCLLEDIETSHYNFLSSQPLSTLTPTPYQQELTNTLHTDHKVLVFKNKPPNPPNILNPLHVLYSNNANDNGVLPAKYHRHIPQTPEKTLDAPEMVNDYYLNLLDWSNQNMLAVALNQTVYLWHHETAEIQCLLTTPDRGNIVTSVAWMNHMSHLAVGTTDKHIELWDSSIGRRVRLMKGHEGRVSALSWNNHILSSGSRDQSIIHHDVRMARPMINIVHNAHNQEVCGLKWSPDGSQLASGGNDNTLQIWDSYTSTKPLFTLDQHQAAVKAIAWCPWQSKLLATGGGTSDRKLRFWNTANGICLNMIDTNSQVSSIQWSPHSKELVSAHGFSENQLTVWKYPAMVRIAELRGHEARILHTALSPDGETVASAGADETLRIWKVFEKPYKGTRQPKHDSSGTMTATIR